MKQKLLDKFPDPLSDTLSPVPMPTPDGHMHISMDNNATPHHEVVARCIPLRYKPQTDTVVQDLISKNVITKVDVPTKWLSPAFFVPKPDGVRMRLVTDYTKLNKYVHRPIHLFPSTRDIIQSIPHGQKTRCRPRVFSISTRRRVIIPHHIPPTPGALQISTCSHGPQCIFRRMVPAFRRRRRGPGLVHEDRRRHHHMGHNH